jgi:hypothetical protein
MAHMVTQLERLLEANARMDAQRDPRGVSPLHEDGQVAYWPKRAEDGLRTLEARLQHEINRVTASRLARELTARKRRDAQTDATRHRLRLARKRARTFRERHHETEAA